MSDSPLPTIAVLILTALFDVTGIQMSQAVSDGLTLLCAVPIHLHVLKTMERE